MHENGPSIFIPISMCAGILLERNTSRNCARLPGLAVYVFISTIMCTLALILAQLNSDGKNTYVGYTTPRFTTAPVPAALKARMEPDLPVLVGSGTRWSDDLRRCRCVPDG